MDTVGESEDAMLARALALSMEQEAAPSHNTSSAPPPAAAAAAPMGAPAAVGGDLGQVVRRVIDSDNSCLFNAVGPASPLAWPYAPSCSPCY